jgi:hypothetical protein
VNEEVIADKLEKILISQAKTESFITINEHRGCGFGHTEREKIKQSILDKETTAHDSIRAVGLAVDKKIEYQSKWLKGLAVTSALFGAIAVWLKFA